MPYTIAQIARYRAQYNPCADGIHICGLRDDAEFGPHVTEANLPPVSLATFQMIKAEYDEPNSEDYEVVIDLFHAYPVITHDD